MKTVSTRLFTTDGVFGPSCHDPGGDWPQLLSLQSSPRLFTLLCAEGHLDRGTQGRGEAAWRCTPPSESWARVWLCPGPGQSLQPSCRLTCLCHSCFSLTFPWSQMSGSAKGYTAALLCPFPGPRAQITSSPSCSCTVELCALALGKVTSYFLRDMFMRPQHYLSVSCALSTS